MNVVNSKEHEEIYDNEFDPEFIHFIESLKQNGENYNMLADILSIIM